MKYLLLTLLILSGCTKVIDEPILTNRMNHLPINEDKTLAGVASYYDYMIGDWSSIGHYVCATRDFVRYSIVEATNVANGKSVRCMVLDYGPSEAVFPDRIIDLSSTAFSEIAGTSEGVVNVIVKQLNQYEL